MKYLNIFKPLTLDFLSTQALTIKDIPYLSARKFGELLYVCTAIFTMSLVLIFTFCLMYIFIVDPILGIANSKEGAFIEGLFISIGFGIITIICAAAFSLFCFLYFFYSKHIHSIYIKEMIGECEKSLDKQYNENIQKLKNQFILLDKAVSSP